MRRDELLLIDMLKAAEAVESFIDGVTREAFIADDMRRTAVQKKLEIMGEAARHVSEDLKQRYPDVPWAQMTGLRNNTIHGYFSIDWDQIWTTATRHVPVDRQRIAEIVAVEFPENTPT